MELFLRAMVAETVSSIWRARNMFIFRKKPVEIHGNIKQVFHDTLVRYRAVKKLCKLCEQVDCFSSRQ